MTLPNLPLATIAIVSLALCTTFGLLLRRRKSDAEVLFALFCGSVALAMLRPFVGSETNGLWWVVAIGGSATCNVYWLVSRALFRGDGAVGWPHAGLALGVAVLIVVWRLATRADAMVDSPVVAVVGALLDFAGVAMLVLAFVEGLRGWSPNQPSAERRLRLAFLTIFGSCVLIGTISGAVAKSVAVGPAWQPAVNSLCAMAIVIFTLWALGQRRHWPVHPAIAATATAVAASEVEVACPQVTPEDRRLAAAIVHLLEVEAIHREPELRVADLTRRLDSAEHKISRAITLGLGERNFNQLVNRHRIRTACRLLEDPGSTLTILEISAQAGFASLGPFNRAFKSATGQTPSTYRVNQQARDRLACG